MADVSSIYHAFVPVDALRSEECRARVFLSARAGDRHDLMLSYRDPLPGNWRGLIVVCAGNSWAGMPSSDKHMARWLATHAPVLYVDPPVSLIRSPRDRHLLGSLSLPPIRIIEPGLAQVSPIINPGHTRAGLRTLGRALQRRAVRSAVSALGVRPRAVIAASADDTLDAVPADVRVFYVTDDYAAGATLMGLSRNWVARAETRQARKADLVVAISDVLRDRWRSTGITAHTIPNGVEADVYRQCDEAPLPSDVTIPAPRAGFVGHLSDRIDLTLLESVADAGVSLLLVGPLSRTSEGLRLERLLGRPEVQWVGAKPFEALPSYLRSISVGLTPYSKSAFNRASFPLKTLEYLAAGRPVVTTSLPVNDLLPPGLITVADDAASFGSAVRRLAHTPQSTTAIARRRAFAARHTWEVRAKQLAELIGLYPGN